MKVHCNEGVAIHIGPEPCMGLREEIGEASAGEYIGQPLSRENLRLSGADVFKITESNMGGALCEHLSNPAWSKTLACVDALCAGTGRSRDWPADGCRRSAWGRRGVKADDERSREV